MSGTIGALLVVELTLTALLLAMWIWRGFLDMKEDDHLVLTEAESHLQRDQVAIRSKVRFLSRYIKVFGVMWALLAMATFGIFVATELNLV